MDKNKTLLIDVTHADLKSAGHLSAGAVTIDSLAVAASKER